MGQEDIDALNRTEAVLMDIANPSLDSSEDILGELMNSTYQQTHKREDVFDYRSAAEVKAEVQTDL